ncbi:MAG: TIGR03032 family protein [Planctomycetales bacterium]|nr:TIGR03032 family protein [Planctomycetales bacterium]
MSTQPKKTSDALQLTASPNFPAWLDQVGVSLAFSTYQVGKLFFVGHKNLERLAVFERTFNRCLGLWTDGESLWLAAAYQLWRLENALSAGTTTADGYDRLFVPRVAYTTGDVDVHDIAVDGAGGLVFVNTLFSCLATLSERYNFTPCWRPPFIDRLTAEDRCHLNGLAMDEGKARFVTACAQSNERGGWREQRRAGGCVIDVASSEIIVQGLSMPHSPRVRNGELWLLNSGEGNLGRVDLQTGRFEPVVFCPGYARGLAFYDKYAIIGLSRPRNETFAGLALDDELAKRRMQPGCGLMVVDLERGVPVEWLNLAGSVEELYDVVVLPGVRRAKALGLKNDDIRHNVWFADDGDVAHWVAGEK